MAYYPWKNSSSIPISNETKVSKGMPDGVKLNGTIWPTSINDGESPPPINESRWGEKTISISMHAFVNNISSDILHVTPFKMLRSNIANQQYDQLSSMSTDGLSSAQDGWNSEDPEVGDKFQADTSSASMIHNKIFISTNDSLIYKLENLGSDLEPEFIIQEIIDPAVLYPTLTRTSMIRGLDNSRSKIWLCEAVNNYLFILFVNKLIILEYDMEAINNYSVRYYGYLPDMNTKYAHNTSDNATPLSPGRSTDACREIPEYNNFIGWKDQAFVDGHIYDPYPQYEDQAYQYNPIQYNDSLLSPKWMGDPNSGYFIMYNTTSTPNEYGATPWPLAWSYCTDDGGSQPPGGEYPYGRLSSTRSRILKVGDGPSTRVTTIPYGSDPHLKSTYRLLSIGWNNNGEPWPFMTTSARSGSIAFAGTVIPSVDLPDYKISDNNINQIVKVIITGDSLVIEGQSANYLVTVLDENDNPYPLIGDTKVYIGYFLEENTEESDLNNPPSEIIIPGGNNTASFVVNTNDADDQLDLNRSFDVAVLDIDRTELQLVYIEPNPVTTVIEDSEVKPVIEFLIDSQSTIEQTTTLQVTIVADISPSEQDILIPFITTGVATENLDYTKSVIDSILMPIGTNSITIDVEIIQDTYAEPDKDIIFILEDPQYATLGAQVTHTITIIGEDQVSLEEAAGPTSLTFENLDPKNLFWGQVGVGNGSPSAITGPVMLPYNSARLQTLITGPGTLSLDWINDTDRSAEVLLNGERAIYLNNDNRDWRSSNGLVLQAEEIVVQFYIYSDYNNVDDQFQLDNIIYTPMIEGPLSNAISDTGLVFVSSGDETFIGQDMLFSPNDSSVSAASIIPSPAPNTTTLITFDVNLDSPNTVLQFEFMFINANYYDKIQLWVDGYRRTDYSQNYGYSSDTWHTVSYEVYDGAHTIEFRYTKDPSSAVNATVAIDNVKFIGS